MNVLYGEFSQNQIAEYKKRLHNRIHWLLVYKEDEYEFLDNYYSSILYHITSLSKVFNDQEEIVELVIVLQTARDLASSDKYNHKRYRKLILDAHDLVDRIKEVDSE